MDRSGQKKRKHPDRQERCKTRSCQYRDRDKCSNMSDERRYTVALLSLFEEKRVPNVQDRGYEPPDEHCPQGDRRGPGKTSRYNQRGRR